MKWINAVADLLLTWLFPDPDMDTDEAKQFRRFTSGGWR